MAQRRPIALHPAFAPFVAAWFAALLGLAVAVLPAGTVSRALAGIGLGALGTAGPVAAIAGAAIFGALVGFLIGKLLARRAAGDPRPIYAEPEMDFEEPALPERKRRPLSIREELTASFPDPRAALGAPPLAGTAGSGDAEQEDRSAQVDEATDRPSALVREIGDDFLILSPQPVHPPRPAPDLDSLLTQFDTALAAFHGEDDETPPQGSQDQSPDPVHAFVARQTGAPAHSPLSGTKKDHQAELRSALDKLARVRRSDDP